MLAGIK